MERSEYDKLDQAEDRMWWFAALHRNLLVLARRAPLESTNLPLLDAGCGTGGFVARLAREYRDRAVLGLDIDHQACMRAAVKSGRPICRGSINELPFAAGSVAAIFSADILCHKTVDERRALLEFRRCLADDGCLILNLPAYRWMFSEHDNAVHSARRYTVGGLTRLLQACGFGSFYATYWNTVLFPLMVMTRKLLPRKPGAGSDVQLYPTPIDVLCRAATAIETALLRRGTKLAFGGSILAVAAKQGASDG